MSNSRPTQSGFFSERRESSASVKMRNFNFTSNDTDGLDNDDLVKKLCDIPAGTTHVDYSHTRLYALSPQELMQVLSSIPPSVIWVNMSNNRLHENIGFDKNNTPIFSALPSTVKSLDLSENYLGAVTGTFYNTVRANPDRFYHALASIPKTVTTLDLGQNRLLDTEDLTHCHHLFKSIPAGVEDLVLSNGFSAPVETINDMPEEMCEHFDGLLACLNKKIQVINFEGLVINLKEYWAMRMQAAVDQVEQVAEEFSRLGM